MGTVKIVQFVLDCINSAIGAFLGFLFAIYLQSRTEKKDSKKKVTLVLNCICEELLDINKGLKHYKADEVISQPIYTPNWFAIVESGAILELLNKDIYFTIIQVYSNIKRLNEEQELSKEKKKEYMNCIIVESDKIIEFVKNAKEKD